MNRFYLQASQREHGGTRIRLYSTAIDHPERSRDLSVPGHVVGIPLVYVGCDRVDFSPSLLTSQ
jgi:hypothetical protein